MSRGQLARQLTARPNSVGEAVGELLTRGLLREGPGRAGGAGRPQVPLWLEVGERGRTVVGVAVRGPRGGESARVQVRAVGLLGRAVGDAWEGPAGAEAVRAMEAVWDARSLGVSIALPGLLAGSSEPAVLPGLFAALGDRPCIFDNDNHALSARWRLNQSPDASAQDTLVVQLADGRLGASLLIAGRPNRGAICGGNELGHTRLPVATDRCFCGHTGCLERIVSTAFLHRHGASRVRTLTELASAYPHGEHGDNRALDTMLEALTMGVANALQLIRPHRLVVVSELTRFAGFRDAWFDRLAASVFPELRERLTLETWDQPLASPAESAAHLGLAALFDA